LRWTIVSFQVPVFAMAAAVFCPEAACAPIEDEQSAVAILHSGRVDDDVQQQAERVDQDMPFAAGDLLGRSKPGGSSVEPPFEPLWRFDCR
jgi:hypothetical protein